MRCDITQSVGVIEQLVRSSIEYDRFELIGAIETLGADFDDACDDLRDDLFKYVAALQEKSNERNTK